MRLCTFDEFLALREGAIFTFVKSGVMTGLHRKGETLPGGADYTGDFFMCDLMAQPRDGGSGDLTPAFDTTESRWGLFDPGQMFAVFDDADVEDLIQALSGKADATGERP